MLATNSLSINWLLTVEGYNDIIDFKVKINLTGEANARFILRNVLRIAGG
jgi:hypothetical protein